MILDTNANSYYYSNADLTAQRDRATQMAANAMQMAAEFTQLTQARPHYENVA